MRIQIPFVYLVSLIVVASLAVFMLAFSVGWIEAEDPGTLLQTYLFTWGIVIAFAILGGVLFGMVFGHRILSVKGFTPIEKGLLEATVEMKKTALHNRDHQDMATLVERIDSLENKIDLLLSGSESGNEGKDTSMVGNDHDNTVQERNVDGKL